jgi:hypothetical protein
MSSNDGSSVKRLAAVPLVIVLVGCGLLGNPTAEMCQIGSALETAYTTALDALAADQAGDAALAERLAGDAARQAEEAHVQLQALDAESRRGDAYQALLEAYLRIGQGANALLPEYASTYGMTADELRRGRTALNDAEVALDGC